MSYEEALKWIHSIGRFGIKPGLERMEALMDRLGNPHRLLRYVHIAGTNGKGSTAAIIASVLKTSGYRVGLYTSPYLVAFNNRIGINGADISPDDLVSQVNIIKPIVEEIARSPQLGQPTEFEVVTALAFNYYASQKPDMVIMEVGLGGRLDATNIITPLISVITNVSLDHTGILGNTVAEIAREKGGIIKEKVPLITAAEDPPVKQVLLEIAAEKNAPCYFVREEAFSDIDSPNNNNFYYGKRKITSGGQTFSFRSTNKHLEELYTPLMGSYQLINNTTAVAALEMLEKEGFIVTENNIRQGIKDVRWPGRLEVISENPLIVLDGAHNPAAVKALTSAVKEHFKYRRLILITGIMEDKDINEILGALVPVADSLILTRPLIERAADPEELKKIVEKSYNISPKVVPAVKMAVEKALSEAEKGDLILITGSFYTISEARSCICKEKLT